jgi:WD40 repeat protein
METTTAEELSALAPSGILLLSYPTEQTVQMWESQSDCENPLWEQSLEPQIDSVWHVEYRAGTHRLLFLSHADRSGAVIALDLNSGQVLYCTKDPNFKDCHISINIAGTKFLTTRENVSGVFIWDAENGTQLLILRTMAEHQMAAFTMDSEADRIVTLQDFNKFHLWNADDGTQLCVFEGFSVKPNRYEEWHGTLAVSAEGSLVAAAVKVAEIGNCVKVGVWNYSTRERLFFVNHDRYGRLSLGLSETTVLCLTIGEICVWDLKSSSVRFRIRGHFSTYFPGFLPGCDSVAVIKSHLSKRIVAVLDVMSGEVREYGQPTHFDVRWIVCAPQVVLL